MVAMPSSWAARAGTSPDHRHSRSVAGERWGDAERGADVGSAKQADHQEENDGPDNGHEEPGGMVLRARLGLADDGPDEAADQGTHDPDGGGRDEPHLIGPGHDRTRDEPRVKPDDDRPEDVEHRGPPLRFTERSGRHGRAISSLQGGV